ncbi:hypothetical protein PsYK624_129710 [Phanerochaete sordida]|uniref:Uncharacterized protein n=1 Tax=Phanerochaete sordida TaxID=48140 RepID=A0A9P3GNP3_9APHY|nr:hypothetical protein PsYK624_129710 [Phanerochaete sordida]
MAALEHQCRSPKPPLIFSTRGQGPYRFGSPELLITPMLQASSPADEVFLPRNMGRRTTAHTSSCPANAKQYVWPGVCRMPSSVVSPTRDIHRVRARHENSVASAARHYTRSGFKAASCHAWTASRYIETG